MTNRRDSPKPPPSSSDKDQLTHTPPQGKSRSVQILARDCAQQTSRRTSSTTGPSPCYELFCRAFGSPPDEAAWQALVEQYWKLVAHWLGQHASEDTCQETFLRFWRAQQNATASFSNRFPNIGAVLKYLKCCAGTTRIEAHRKEEKRRLLLERLKDATQAELVLMRTRSEWRAGEFDQRRLVRSKLKDEREYAVFEGTYYRGLPPREIQAERPDLFPDVQRVYRVKENLLRRLKRDQELRDWWADSNPKSNNVDGGKRHPPTIQ